MTLEKLNNQEVVLSATVNLYWQELQDKFFGVKNQTILSLNKKLNQICSDAQDGNLFAIAILKSVMKACNHNKRSYIGDKEYRSTSNSVKNLSLLKPKRIIKFGIHYDNKLISLILREIYSLNLPLSIIKSSAFYGKISDRNASQQIEKVLSGLLDIYNQCMKYGKLYKQVSTEDFAGKSSLFNDANMHFESTLKLKLTDDILSGKYKNSMFNITYKHNLINLHQISEESDLDIDSKLESTEEKTASDDVNHDENEPNDEINEAIA